MTNPPQFHADAVEEHIEVKRPSLKMSTNILLLLFLHAELILATQILLLGTRVEGEGGVAIKRTVGEGPLGGAMIRIGGSVMNVEWKKTLSLSVQRRVIQSPIPVISLSPLPSLFLSPVLP